MSNPRPPTSDGPVLVTGANGFVGRALCNALATLGRRVRRVVRTEAAGLENAIAVGNIHGPTNWGRALEGVSCVVHLAARTHVLNETAADPLAEYRRINVDGTVTLARQAARAGVRRLVFLSSVKVNGETTVAPFTERDAPRPEDSYGISKWEAEQALARASAENGMEFVVLRPPLVYGPGVGGNFLRIMRLVARGVPLPLASIANRRSLVYLGNLVGAIVTVADTPHAANHTFLVSDGEDVSTPDLVRAIAHALDVPPRLLPCPRAMLDLGAALTGRRAELARLTSSLQVDGSALCAELGWRPPYTVEQGLAETARWFRKVMAQR